MNIPKFFSAKIYYLLIWFTLLLSSCNFPEDPDATLSKVRYHKLLVGQCPNYSTAVEEYETRFINTLAENLDAKITIIHDTQENLYHQLQNHQLYLVVCGIIKDSPWADKLAFSKNYSINKKLYVAAVPAGENAWLLFINNFINGYKG